MRFNEKPPMPIIDLRRGYMAWIKCQYRNPQDPNGPLITNESVDDDWFWATCVESTPINLEAK